MRRILLTFVTTVTAVVGLFGYRTSSPGYIAPPAAVVAAAALGVGQTYAGDVVQTRWGPVQVQITVANGAITSADAVQVPTGNHRDVEINARAVPILNAEVLADQSADIDSVSGATVTSGGYTTSLQSALDAADL